MLLAIGHAGQAGRHFIRAALTAAIGQLQQPEEVEKPSEREQREALHLDQDRQSVSGTPELARTIFGKIDATTVFVADVTVVAGLPPREAKRQGVNQVGISVAPTPERRAHMGSLTRVLDPALPHSQVMVYRAKYECKLEVHVYRLSHSLAARVGYTLEKLILHLT